MFAALPRACHPFLALALGAAATFGFAPFDQPWIWPLSLAAMLSLCWTQRPKRAFLLGWLWGLAHFASGVHWVYISTHVYGGAPWWLGALLGAALWSYLALYPALAIALTVRLAQRSQPAALWAFAPWFAISEALRGWVGTGFAWLSAGDLALNTPLSALVPVLGAPGLTLVWAGLAAAAVASAQSRRVVPLAATASIVAIASLLCPKPEHWTKAQGALIATAVIQGQGEITMDQKWRPENRQILVERFASLTLAAAGTPIVVWPEGPLPATHAQLAPVYLPMLAGPLAAQNSTLVAGVLMDNPSASGRFQGPYNSVLLLGKDQGRYDKRHLVPFGEFFPIPDFMRPLMDVLGTPYSDFSFGAPNQPLLRIQGQPVFASICFEDVFANEFRQHALGASLLINQTNDSWFGAGMAPWQHLAIARMRALENGRWLIRATNSGVSALIAPNGDTAARTKGLYRTAVLKGSVQPRAGLTPFARFGLLGAGLLTAALLFMAWRAYRKTPALPRA